MIYFTKILPVFLLPIGLTLGLILLGLVFKRKFLVIAACVFLYACGTPIVARFSLSLIERGAERERAEDAPSADGIVVLSSGRLVAPGKAGVSEWGDGDRFFGGVELFAAKKAPVLIFTGGWAPWEPDARSEGDILVDYTRMFGFPREAVLTTQKVMNTAGEAEAVASIFKARNFSEKNGPQSPWKIFLVTSAFHMPRARTQFERQGFEVIPFPVDFLVSTGTRISLLDFFPSAGALNQTELALREFYGRVIYRVR